MFSYGMKDVPVGGLDQDRWPANPDYDNPTLPRMSRRLRASMKTVKHQAILIVERDAQFREGALHLLLAAGYENRHLATVLDKICLSAST
jgi:hypothetical protein